MNIGSRAPYWQPVIAAQWLRQEGRCYWCGCPLTLRRVESHRNGVIEEQRVRKWRDWTI